MMDEPEIENSRWRLGGIALVIGVVLAADRLVRASTQRADGMSRARHGG